MKKIHTVALLGKDSIIAAGEKNDCVVYAIATAFDMDYDDAHKEVAKRFGREDGEGTKSSALKRELTEGTTINGKTVTKVIEGLTKAYKVYGQIVPRKPRLSSFVKNNPEGTYIIMTRDHALTVKNGTILDSHKEPKDKALVLRAYKID